MIETENEYLSLIEQGVESWNRWREQHPGVTPDLHRAYLFEANLAGANLHNVNLSRACLIGANLRGANLEGANLQSSYASGANLQQANLSQADLEGANFSQADLTDADLSQAHATATNFNGARLTGACLADWQIDRSTQLEDVECQWFYLGRYQQERQPSKGKFRPGEFSQRVQGVVGTHPAQVAVPASEMAIAADTSTAVGVLTPVQPATSPVLRPGEPIPVSPYDRDRDWRLLAGGIAIGVGVSAVTIALATQFIGSRSQSIQPVTQSASQISSPASLPCQEPPLPSISDRNADYEYEVGTKYYGAIVDGLPADGRGTMVYSSGNRYDGEYRNGKREGCGTFTFVNGRRYVGQFRNDWFEGQGIWTLESGDRYIGEFRNNKCNGQGTFILADGSSRSGRWEDGQLVGADLSCDRTPMYMPSSVEG